MSSLSGVCQSRSVCGRPAGARPLPVFCRCRTRVSRRMPVSRRRNVFSALSAVLRSICRMRHHHQAVFRNICISLKTSLLLLFGIPSRIPLYYSTHGRICQLLAKIRLPRKKRHAASCTPLPYFIGQTLPSRCRYPAPCRCDLPHNPRRPCGRRLRRSHRWQHRSSAPCP